MLDVTAMEIPSNTEIYKVSLQGSSSATFTSAIFDLAEITLGAAEVIGGEQGSAIGRYKVPLTIENNGTVWPYVRDYTDVAGDIATGINFSAHLRK